MDGYHLKYNGGSKIYSAFGEEIASLPDDFYRSCSRALTGEKDTERPCLYYHIGQCKAPCQGYITEEEYRKNIEGILEFLNGNYGLLTKRLTAEMLEASERMEFEKAAEYRDLLNSVKKLTQQQKASDNEGSNRDIIAFATAEDEASVSFTAPALV